ncbi:hypothetical protein RF11_16047 [Thelohanellus kitauei]|uniref:Uncharacterized protein n=1 Tax=Thelohanellus kitauei TaxID=669202 RepID=A0A0C2JBL8_THEKT|nr:hypothetical protein RF11_16047 [Thelohanellus kitauei]
MMLCYTGANLSSINKDIWSTLEAPNDDINVKITAYMGNDISIMGYSCVEVQLGHSKKKLLVFVTKNNDTPIFGLDWLNAFGISFCFRGKSTITTTHRINHINLKDLLKRKPSLFNDSLGHVKGKKVKLHRGADETLVFGDHDRCHLQLSKALKTKFNG